MEKKIIKTNRAPQAIGPYSQAISITSANRLLFLSGQIPIVPETGELLQGSIVEQAERVMKNLEAVLKEAEMNFSNVVKTTIFLKDLSDFQKVNEVYAKWMGESLPARATVQVSALPKNVGVEIEMIAAD